MGGLRGGRHLHPTLFKLKQLFRADRFDLIRRADDAVETGFPSENREASSLQFVSPPKRRNVAR